MFQNVVLETNGRVGVVRLNRADRHNAFDDQTILEVIEAMGEMERDPSVRVVLLSSSGKSFSAGADLRWMQRAAAQSFEENLRDARNLAEMLRRIAQLSKPTVARVQGPAYGGGVGVIAACDVAVALADAQFALTEVRLGIIPAAISPHVIQAIGPRHARRYMLTAERFSASEACRIGLVHEVAPDAASLDETVGRILHSVLQNGPAALAACKDLTIATAGRSLTPELIEDTAQRIASIRASEEAKEGMAAFFAKRKPIWAGTVEEGQAEAPASVDTPH